ncbi:hypothetical protein TTHERM_00335670 (macronuclear) [Tetrahymena thermophila SB210]|uniref:Uncharacterized protein n=1 Tax=Tetrahymena thermophila (strain SB210) TaxID=312017 RepID=I7M1P4_TETTS|nr:hypothetical protein TTHERM_00335670 [Tetrahymena thermophila SB210]EAR97290.2 hypothetical protein TTHERM_00335670 [Tetrahymena thermophila SB210]|eukprot:XP_001017535.2 hypothetical protein TTHERM_00335670 [Tetrahymena thermophila SB210]
MNLLQSPFQQYSEYFTITYYTKQNKIISFIDLLVQSPDSSTINSQGQLQTYQTSYYQLESECNQIVMNKKDNSILVGCENAKIFFKKPVDNTEPKFQQSQKGQILNNFMTFSESDILVWFNKIYVEFYTFSSLEYLGNYQIEQPDEFLIDFFQFTQIKQFVVCTVKRILVFNITNKNITIASQSSQFEDIRGWIGLGNLQLIVGYGKIFKIQEVSVQIYCGVIIDYNNVIQSQSDQSYVLLRKVDIFQ